MLSSHLISRHVMSSHARSCTVASSVAGKGVARLGEAGTMTLVTQTLGRIQKVDPLSSYKVPFSG